MLWGESGWGGPLHCKTHSAGGLERKKEREGRNWKRSFSSIRRILGGLEDFCQID